MTTPETGPSAPVKPWIPGDDTFGARLALVRQRMGWGNVAEAAQACGIPVPSWRNWERDGRTPRGIVEIASQISERTGCDYMWLLTGKRVDRSVTAQAGSAPAVTWTKPLVPTQPRPSGPMSRTVPKPSSRRPARRDVFVAERMPDTPMELLGLAGEA